MATEILPASCRRSIALAALFLMAGAVLYNNWTLSSTYNPDLPAASAFVSEYSVPSQPHSALFREMDAASGILVLIGAIMIGIHRHFLRVSGCVTRYLAAPEGWSIMAWSGTVIFAVSTVADAIFPMTCTLSTVTPAEANVLPCVGPLATTHDVTSTMAGTGAIIALLATLVLLGRAYGSTWSRSPLMWLFIVLALIHVSSTIYTFVGALVPQMPFIGYVQRVAIGALSLWAVLFVLSPTGRAVLRGQHRVASQSLSHILSSAASSPVLSPTRS